MLLLLVAATGCGFLDRVFGPDDPLTVLFRHRDQWNALGIGDYSFHYQLGNCECLDASVQPVRIVVRNGQVVEVMNTIYDMPLAVGSWPSIDAIFARAERDMRAGYRMDITYDGKFHFPGRIAADYPMTVDDEYTITANSLAPIPK